MFYLRPELHLGCQPDILVPDIAGWRRDRLAGLPRQRPWTTVAPDWTCEFLLPTTRGVARGPKLDIYLREGVRHMWHIDLALPLLEIYRLHGQHLLRLPAHTGTISARVEPFDTLELPLQWLWEP